MSKAKNDAVKKTNLSKTHVPDKVYAYSLQVRHALYELLSCSDNDIVSIEVFDDVATQKDDGSIEATQIKSVLSNKNPISNRAVDLWKTFYNWLLAVKASELSSSSTNFKLFVAAERHGEIANSFSNAKTLEEAKKAWKEAKNEFYDKKGKEKNLSDEYALYIRDFFNHNNMLPACMIIQNFSLATIKDNYTTILYNTFCQKVLIPEDLLENVFIYILGWLDKKTAELVESSKVMSITYKDFKFQLIAITSEFNQKLSLKELAPRPTEEEIKSEYDAVRRYIRQLDIVDCNYTDKIEAISDYLRASTNRTLWASRGDISESNLKNYKDELITKWNNKKNIIKLTEKNLSPEEQGKLLYFRCKENSISIGHLCVPSFFTSGCYHALSDDMKIGWHPKYEKLLNEGCENNERSK
ncbi:hypothetical protein DCCM_2887 [Desulfocucumis palustris]|uniref:ABC-three component systems C-terminal domain-containing protein n=1 Tax=Desulfocucumis palustris TaxID=1898651 RepID=A0A2L2XHR3_9FIRM|nr:ABC-three component system protein [Desulfocucumis palustris]GBF33776.1 hypothetical protein DCCM_2887 [Desulfocucumis palustris]